MTGLLVVLACATPVPETADTADTAQLAVTADTAATVACNDPTDQDCDGWSPPEDCDDLEPDAHPYAYDPLYDDDRRDLDCNGRDGPLVADVLGGLTQVSTSDVDGDGVPELLGQRSSTEWEDITVRVFFGPALAEADAWAAIGWWAASLGDLNADGVEELLTFTWVEGATEWDNYIPLLAVYDGAQAVADAGRGAENATWLHSFVLDFSSPGYGPLWGRLGDLDGDGVPEVRAGGYAFPVTRVLDSSFSVADAPWTFPGSRLESLEPGDADGDGLSDLIGPDTLFLGDTVQGGGTFVAADGIDAPYLRGWAGDISGDGLDDVWYGGVDPSYSFRVVSLAGAPVAGVAAPFATLEGSGLAQFSNSEAGPLGDADQDGYGDFALQGVEGRGSNYENHATYLFRGARLAGTLVSDDADRKLGYRGERTVLGDLDQDGVDEVFFEWGSVGIMDGATLFP